MAAVQRNFVILEIAWIAILAVSAITAVVFKQRPTPNGIALGFVVAAATLLCFDLVADRRGAIYYAALSQRPDGGANPSAPMGAPSPT
jgi:hypothetical protein